MTKPTQANTAELRKDARGVTSDAASDLGLKYLTTKLAKAASRADQVSSRIEIHKACHGRFTGLRIVNNENDAGASLLLSVDTASTFSADGKPTSTIIPSAVLGLSPIIRLALTPEDLAKINQVFALSNASKYGLALSGDFSFPTTGSSQIRFHSNADLGFNLGSVNLKATVTQGIPLQFEVPNGKSNLPPVAFTNHAGPIERLKRKSESGHYSAEDYLNGISVGRVKQIHLGGHEQQGDILVDTHSSTIADPVWKLYQSSIDRFGKIPCLIEWDNDLPDLTLLLQQAKRAREFMNYELES